jgi:hypothetical protein
MLRTRGTVSPVAILRELSTYGFNAMELLQFTLL